MTRDELMEILARALYDTHESEPWDHATLGRQASYLVDGAVMVPQVVAFVAAWLETICDGGLYTKDEIPGVWRYTMTPDERDVQREEMETGA